MKLKSLFIAAFVGLGAITGMQSAQAETLRVGMECTYAPFNYRNESGDLVGYDVDLAKGVAEIIGAELEYVCQKWDGMIPALLANKFDLIIASMSITEKRLESIDFSSPYRFSIGRLVGRKGLDVTLFDDTGNPIPDNFKGLKVGLERASTYASWFEAKLPGADVILYDNNEALYLDLQNGRTDLIMTNPMKAHLKFLSKEDGSGFELVGPEIDEEKYFGIGVGVGLRKGNEELRDKISAAIKQLINDGSLETYALKYFPFKLHKQEWGQ
jgi:polar amino acid transport system substrate-binding protein